MAVIKDIKINGADASVSTFGRHSLADGLPAFDWPNSGFRFRFKGNGVILSFKTFKTPYTFYVLVGVDGKQQRFALSTGDEKIIIEGLTDKEHSLELIKITEGEERIVFAGADIFGKSPAIMPAEEKPYPLKIEFLGDSLTAGYGNLAPATEKLFHTFEQDSTRAYAYICASLLGADAHYECISGQGIYQNCNGVKSNEIPTFFTHASRETKEPWDFSSWTPDVVVINAGTNDYCGKVTDENFTNAAADFLRLIRSKYPKALIIWAYGMTQKLAFPAIKTAIAEVNDPSVRLLALESMYDKKDELGGNGHPNVKSHKRVGRFVADYIKKELGL